MKLTTKARTAIPTKQFALPGKRAYPIEDRAHAANAKSRVAQNGTPAQKAQVDAKVASKYPSMGKGTQHPQSHDAFHSLGAPKKGETY